MGSLSKVVSRRYGIAQPRLYAWRRLYTDGPQLTTGAREQVGPTSDYDAREKEVHDLLLLLGKEDPGKREAPPRIGPG